MPNLGDSCLGRGVVDKVEGEMVAVVEAVESLSGREGRVTGCKTK